MPFEDESVVPVLDRATRGVGGGMVGPKKSVAELSCRAKADRGGIDVDASFVGW